MICFLIKKPLEQCQVPEKSLFCKKKKNWFRINRLQLYFKLTSHWIELVSQLFIIYHVRQTNITLS
jgi:hypothetical protein